jgi:hypothetical protein
MSATADKLTAIEEKIGKTRTVLAELRDQPDAFKNGERLKMTAEAELERLQEQQIELLKDFADGNDTGTGGGSWALDGLDDPRVKAVLEEVSASGAPFNRLPLGKAIGARALARQLGTVANAMAADGR